MHNYRICIQYDGGRYDGWQRLGKDKTDNTVEYKIKDVLKKFTGEDTELMCGCRTEKGVHALRQTANFKLNVLKKDYELKNYLNRYLPRDIAILELEEVDDRFHSQLNAKAKVYEYRLDTANVADVFFRKYRYHTFNVPDFESMEKAAGYFLGEHDFKAFTTARKSKSTVRRIDSIQIKHENDYATITIKANDFLHNMARYMIGILLDVGSGLRKPEDIKKILSGQDLQMSLPAEGYGLFLKDVIY